MRGVCGSGDQVSSSTRTGGGCGWLMGVHELKFVGLFTLTRAVVIFTNLEPI